MRWPRRGGDQFEPIHREVDLLPGAVSDPGSRSTQLSTNVSGGRRVAADPLETAWKIQAALVDWTGKADTKASIALSVQSTVLALVGVLATSGHGTGVRSVPSQVLLWVGGHPPRRSRSRCRCGSPQLETRAQRARPGRRLPVLRASPPLRARGTGGGSAVGYRAVCLVATDRGHERDRLDQAPSSAALICTSGDGLLRACCLGCNRVRKPRGWGR